MKLIDADELAPMIARLFEMMPTADPVKHGRWEWIGGYGYQYRCSECIMCAERTTNYCPNCGAYMVGGDENG